MATDCAARCAAFGHPSPYVETKTSGMESLGEPPAHWECRRLKTLCEMQSGEAITAESIEETGEYPVYGGNGLRGYSSTYTHDGEYALIGRQGALCGNVHLVSGRFWASEHAVVTTLHGDHVLEWFVSLLRAMNLNQYSIAAAQPGLSVDRVLNLWAPIPPQPEQAAIARFLDRATSRIDRYIRAKEKLITLLEEQKQAIISDVVTGRIDVRTGRPYAAYKPSGVEWLGEVPAHWDVRKVRQCGTIVGGMTPSMAERRFWDGDIPWVTPKDMKAELIDDSAITVSRKALEETPLALLPTSAVLIVVRGMILARKVPVAATTNAVTINQDMKAVCPNAGIVAEFLAHQMTSAQSALMAIIDEAGHGTRRLPTERWRNLEICIPPQAEQEVIVANLRNKKLVIDTTVDCITRQIHALHQYRARLIADVVTGKLDVRGMAPALPRQTDMAVADLAEA